MYVVIGMTNIALKEEELARDIEYLLMTYGIEWIETSTIHSMFYQFWGQSSPIDAINLTI